MTGNALLRGKRSGRQPLTAGNENIKLLMACIFTLLILIWGCSSSGSSSPYSALNEYAQMDEKDIQILQENDQLGAYGRPIRIDSVKDMTIGAKVSTSNSSYIVRPIFDVALLNKDGYLDDNLSSSTKGVTDITLMSNKSASYYSDQEKYDFKASTKFGGIQASAAYHQENKRGEASSDGSVNVTMSYNNTGAYVELTTGGFSGNANFTSYLIGSKLDADAVKSYVNYEESYVTGQSGDKYISSLIINNGGKLSDQENAYGNIQLLGEMERIFGILKKQYSECSDAGIRNQLLTNMKSLKYFISNAINSFYSYNGDSFVSRINAMNYGLGNGTLTFSQKNGNTENIYSAALSSSYSGLGASVSGSASVMVSRQSGWANAYKDIKVESRSLPADVIDTTAWANSIFSMLSNESSAISVPPLTITSNGELTLPSPTETKKDPASPPDSCFGTYDDWKQYQADKKANAQQDKQQADAEKKKIDEKGVQEALKKANISSPKLYQAYANQLQLLKGRRSVAAPPLLADNIMRVNKMFVSGFDTTPYDKVIPQLRPNLDIPGQPTTLAGFPNISAIMMTIDKLGQLNSYLRFLSGIAVSRVTPEISNQYNNFYQTFTENAFSMIEIQLKQGKDIPDSLMASFSIEMFGQAGSENNSILYQVFNDIDAYNFILKTLLEPNNAKIWSSAPGGYMPFFWDDNNQLSFSNVLGKKTGVSPYLNPYLSLSFSPFTEPSKDPLSFYTNSFQTPWFPVFQYNMAQSSNLIFIQMAGPYQIIYGYDYVIVPNAPNFNTTNPPTDIFINSDLIKLISQSSNGFKITTTPDDNDNLHWRYSLYFPNVTPETVKVKKYNVLTIPLGRWGSFYRKPSSSYQNYLIGDVFLYWDSWKWEGICNSGKERYVYKTDEKGNFTQVDMCYDGYGYNNNGAILLLPVNRATCPFNFNKAFSYATNMDATDIIQDNSYEAAYKAAMMQ